MNITSQYIAPCSLGQIPIEHTCFLLLTTNKLLVRKSGTEYHLPTFSQVKDLLPATAELEYLGMHNEHSCYCSTIKETDIGSGDLELINIRDISSLMKDSGLFTLAGKANHILHWNRENQYCGRCGHATVNKKEERAKVCPGCGNIIYPRISPATITVVLKEDQILLAHNRHFKEGLYSLIAGFAEPGETLEQCVEREIREEVGLKVKNIRYFTSQPWPFPDSLMAAFIAEYESGEITVDETEITDAAWYHAGHLPEIPSTDSVAGRMIRWYQNKYSGN